MSVGLITISAPLLSRAWVLLSNEGASYLCTVQLSKTSNILADSDMLIHMVRVADRCCLLLSFSGYRIILYGLNTHLIMIPIRSRVCLKRKVKRLCCNFGSNLILRPKIYNITPNDFRMPWWRLLCQIYKVLNSNLVSWKASFPNESRQLASEYLANKWRRLGEWMNITTKSQVKIMYLNYICHSRPRFRLYPRVC